MSSQLLINVFLKPFTALKEHVLTYVIFKAPPNETAYIKLEPSESIKITYYYSIQHMVQSKGAKLGRNVPCPDQRQIQFWTY